MSNAMLPKIDERDRKEAKKYGSSWVHYSKLFERTRILATEFCDKVPQMHICPDCAEKIERHDIYRLENVNKLLAMILGEMQLDVDTVTSVQQNINEDRIANEILRKEFCDEQN